MKNDTNSAAACVPSRLLKEVRVPRVQVADGESHVSTSSCSTEALKDKADSRRDPRAVPSALRSYAGPSKVFVGCFVNTVMK